MLRNRMAMDIFNDANIDAYDPFKERKIREMLSQEIESVMNQGINIASAINPNPDRIEDIFKTPGSIFSPIVY